MSTREYIIDKAFELFLQHNYESVSISQIIESIGMTKGAIYHHFSSKEDLFKAVIDKYLIFPDFTKENINSLSELNEIIVERVHEMLVRLLPNDSEFVTFNYLTLIADALRHYPGYEVENQNYIRRQINNTKIILGNAIQKGEIRSDIDIDVIANLYFSATIGLAGNLLQRYTVKESIRFLKSQINQLYSLLKK